MSIAGQTAGLRIERRKDRGTKPILHTIRLILTGTPTLREDFVNCGMTPWRGRLLGIRTGEVTLEEALARGPVV